jgi:hypothetical protein
VTENRTLERLRGYLATLQGVDQRYIKDRNGYYPAEGDVQIINRTALELIDLFNDRVSTAQYAKMVQVAYTNGVNNMSNTPSLSCVRDISTVVTAAITRITEHPEILEVSKGIETTPSAALDQPKPDEENFPDKITVKWLIDKMPIAYWWNLGVSFALVFLSGLTIGSEFPSPVKSAIAFFKHIFTD